jgi:pimeloyl-ACP methyl ester carboxylesterase
LYDDWVALDTPWGFEIEQIEVPVLVLHGRQDWLVPFANGEWLAAHIPAAQAWLTDHDGHLTLVDRVEDVHEWLLERMP